LFGLFGASPRAGEARRQNRRIAAQPAHLVSGAHAII
jgi:hypothetical protein